MTISAGTLTGSNSTTDAASYATASITPGSNRLVLALVYNRVSAGTANEPTLTGNGLTWVKVATENSISALRRLTLYRAMGASPSTGAVTIAMAGQTQLHCMWSIVEFDGVVATGTNGSGAVVQSAQSTATATSITATLAAFANTANATYGGFFHAADELSTVGSGFTALHNLQQTENGVSMLSEYKLTNDTGVDASWTTSAQAMAIAVEIRALRTQSLAGATTPTSTVAKAAAKPLGGPTTPTGALSKAVAKPASGSTTPTSALSKAGAKLLAGAVTPTGAVTKAIGNVLSGITTPTSVLSKAVAKSASGSITPSGASSNLILHQLNLAGSITPTSTITESIAKVLAGASTPTSTLAKAVAKSLAGTSTPTSVVTKLVSKLLGGATIPSGALAQTRAKALSGSITPSSSLVKAVAKSLRGYMLPPITRSGNEITDATRRRGIEGDGRAYPDGSYGIWRAATNLLTNGGFETNTTGWTALATGSIARITSDFKFGAACGEVTCAAANDGVRTNGNALTSATVYTASMWVKATSGKSIRLRAMRADLTTQIGSVSVTATGIFQKVALTFTAAATETEYLFVENTTDGTFVRVDGAMLQTGAVDTPYKHTDGGTATRPAARVQFPVAGLFTTTVGSVAIRVRSGWGNSLEPGATDLYYWDWRDSNNERMGVFYEVATNRVGLFRFSGGVFSGLVYVALTVAVGDEFDIEAAWDATQIKLSVNGAAFTTLSTATIPTLAATLCDIGTRNGAASSEIHSDVFWFMAWSIAISNADAAASHALGSTDPTISALPGSPTLVLTFGEVGVVALTPAKALSGVIAVAATLTKVVSKALTGSIATAGAITESVAKSLSGLITPTGDLSKLFTKAPFAGSVNPTGTASEAISKPLGGSVTPIGTIARSLSQNLAGAIGPGGTLRKAIDHFLGGSVTPQGQVSSIKLKLQYLSGILLVRGSLRTLKATAYLPGMDWPPRICMDLITMVRARWNR